MKNVLIYLFTFLIICFILPAILTKTPAKVENIEQNNKTQEKDENSINNVNKEKYEYNKYGKIKLLHSKTGEIEEVELDTYLCNVVSAEMPADFHIEALKAQAIVARTYTVYKINNKKHQNADICDDSKCCQAWISKNKRFERWVDGKKEENWNKIETAVNSTKGKIITYNNEPINAFFHSNSGGITELPVNVWGGGSDLPYLQIVETSGEDTYNQFNSEINLTNDELLNKLKEKYSDIKINFEDNEEIKILEYTDSKRVKTVKFGNINISGTEARSILGLKSTNFEIIKEKDRVIFKVKGYGHGVGMSQTGADSMAKQGKNYEEIIKHFYAGIEIKSINEL